MLNIRILRDSLEEIRDQLGHRGNEVNWDKIIQLDNIRRELLTATEKERHRRKTLLTEITSQKREGLPDNFEMLAEVKNLADIIKTQETKIKPLEDELNAILFQIPNLPHNTVPIGRDETQNKEYKDDEKKNNKIITRRIKHKALA